MRTQWQTSISQAEYLIPNFEIVLGVVAKTLYYSRKLDSHRTGCLRWHWIFTLTLQEIHPVQSKCLDFNQSLVLSRNGDRDVIDEQCIRRSFPPFNAYEM